MVAYDYRRRRMAGSATGSGAGLKATSCRTDAFAGTDIPYSVAQLKELDEAPGKTGGCGILFEPPFQPNPAPWPDAADTQGNVMALPSAGSSVATIVNLTEKNCGGTKPPATLNFTAKEVSRIFGGDAATWNDKELVETDPGLEKCTAPIIRASSVRTTPGRRTFSSNILSAWTTNVQVPRVHPGKNGKPTSRRTPNGRANRNPAEKATACTDIITAGSEKR